MGSSPAAALATPHWPPKLISCPVALQTGVPDSAPSAVQGEPSLSSPHWAPFANAACRAACLCCLQGRALLCAQLCSPGLAGPFLQLLSGQAVRFCEGLSCPKSRTWPGSCQPTPVASAEPHNCSLFAVPCEFACWHFTYVFYEHVLNSFGPGLDSQGLEFIADWVKLLKIDCYPL